MAKENIEDVPTEVLLKRKRFILVIAGIFIGVSLVMIGLILYDLITEGDIKTSTFSGLVPALACFWIPLFMLSRVNNELKRRKNN